MNRNGVRGHTQAKLTQFLTGDAVGVFEPPAISSNHGHKVNREWFIEAELRRRFPQHLWIVRILPDEVSIQFWLPPHKQENQCCAMTHHLRGDRIVIEELLDEVSAWLDRLNSQI